MSRAQQRRPGEAEAAAVSEGTSTTLKVARGTVCTRKSCGRPLDRKTSIQTRIGPMCRRHADRLPPHLRRVGAR